MSLYETEIVFRMGESAGAEFNRYWNESVRATTTASGARFRAEQKPAGGPAMVLPAEVTIIAGQVMELLHSDLAKEALKSVGTAAGTAVAKFIWSKLRDFFRRPQPAPVPRKVVIIVNRKEILFSPQAMEPDPPKEFVDALQ